MCSLSCFIDRVISKLCCLRLGFVLNNSCQARQTKTITYVRLIFDISLVHLYLYSISVVGWIQLTHLCNISLKKSSSQALRNISEKSSGDVRQNYQMIVEIIHWFVLKPRESTSGHFLRNLFRSQFILGLLKLSQHFRSPFSSQEIRKTRRLDLISRLMFLSNE